MKKQLLFLAALLCFVGITIQAQQRKVLVEEFTSSTCYPYCPQLNALLTPWLENNSEKVTVIKYQMNWPGTGGDPYYTAEGGTRRNFYGVTGVPAPFVNGVAIGGSTIQQMMNNIETSVNAAYTQPAYVDIAGTFSLDYHTIYATINITTTIDIDEGNSLRLYVAIVEKETYKNKKTNGETVFYQVMKKFMPNASGTILGELAANETITMEFEWEFKGEYRLPPNGNSPINHNIEHSVENFDNLEVVAWVQNSSTKEVKNSCTAKKLLTVNYNTINPEKGTLIASVDGAPFTSGTQIAQGSLIEFTAIPNNNFKVKEWKLNGEVVPDNTTNNFTLELSEESNVSVEFVENIGISVNELTNIELYPNPVTNELYINNVQDIQTITITNLMGQTVKEETLDGKPNTVISTENLPSGLLFVILRNKDGLEIIRKIMKQ